MPPVKRRRFLEQTAATISALGFPAIIPASALGKDGKPAPSNRTTLGLIGCGGRGTDVVKNFLNDPRVQVIAVCDVERESGRYNKGIIKKAGTLGREPMRRLVDSTYEGKVCSTHEDFRELLQRADVDAVQIATPDHWHALQAVAAARAGQAHLLRKAAQPHHRPGALHERCGAQSRRRLADRQPAAQ